MSRLLMIALMLLLILGLTQEAGSQELSSSLYSTGGEYFGDPFAADRLQLSGVPAPGRQIDGRRLSNAIAARSFAAVSAPEPRTFAVHDLLTVIIREDMQTKFASSLETTKESTFTGEVAEFPRLSLSDLIDFQLQPNTFPNGTLKLNVKGKNEFEGDGDYSNKQSMTGRLQATIIDIKPNGNVVIEARKSVQSDKERYNLVATGTCRVDDITGDNTILSSQLADLFIDKQHQGFVKKAADKGVLTQVLDFLFPW